MRLVPVRPDRWKKRLTEVSTVSLAIVILALGVTSAATAEVVRDPTGNVAVGTSPGDNPSASTLSVALGGCATGYIAVGVGGCAPSGYVGVGLLGSGANGVVAVADGGNVSGSNPCSLVCAPPGTAVTGGQGVAGCASSGTGIAVNLGGGDACGSILAVSNGGSAYSNFVAASNSGNASGGQASASVTGTAGQYGPNFNDGSTACYGTGVSVSVAADACTGGTGAAVAPNGDAYGSGGVTGGTAWAKRTVVGAPATAAAGTYVHTGLNTVKDAYQTAIVATAPPVNPVELAAKYAETAQSLPCVSEQLATGIQETATRATTTPPSGTGCGLGVPPVPPTAPGTRSTTASPPPSGQERYWPWANFFSTWLEKGIENGCGPQMAYAMYKTYGMPSQKRLYDEMGTKRAGGTTMDTMAAVIRRYYNGSSKPINDFPEDADTVMNRVVSNIVNHYQGAIIALDPGVSHWLGSEINDGVERHYGNHAVGVWGYNLYQGGWLWLVDGQDWWTWGARNPYGVDNFVSLAKVWAAMKAVNGKDYGEMIW